MLGATGQRLVDRWKEMATQAGTRMARAVVDTTVVAMRALERLRARWLKGSPRLHPERLQAIERLWEDTVAPSPKMTGAVGPEATQALRRETAGKTQALRRKSPARRKPPQPREEGRKTVQSPAPAGKRTTAPVPPGNEGRKTVQAPAPAGKRTTAPATRKKAGAAKKAGAQKKQAPRRRS